MLDGEDIERRIVVNVELVVVNFSGHAVIVFSDESICRLQPLKDSQSLLRKLRSYVVAPKCKPRGIPGDDIAREARIIRESPALRIQGFHASHISFGPLHPSVNDLVRGRDHRIAAFIHEMLQCLFVCIFIVFKQLKFANGVCVARHREANHKGELLLLLWR